MRGDGAPGRRVRRAARAAEALEPHALDGDHWTLAAVGVRPDLQRRGLGARLLRPALDGFDARGETAALETSAPENVPFYERLGFAVRAEVAMPAGGPRVWLMVRPPA